MSLLSGIMKMTATISIVVVIVNLWLYKWYYQFYKKTQGVILMGAVSLEHMSKMVSTIGAVYSKLDSLAFIPRNSKNISHWSGLVYTVDGEAFLVSPRENYLIKVIHLDHPEVKYDRRTKQRYVISNNGTTKNVIDRLTPAPMNLTLGQYVQFMQDQWASHTYNLFGYNCQSGVADTVNHYMPDTIQPPNKGKVLFKEGMKDILLNRSG